MTATTHYSITYVEQNQSGKYITVNQAFDVIDTALNTLASGGSITLAGDVTGAVGTTVVAAIQGIGVSTTDPTTDQVLKYNGTAWAPATLTAVTSVTMGGDISGSSASATVAKIQGRSVASTSPSNGYVLAWNNGATQWEPTAPTVTSSVTMGGDVSGSSSSATVAKIQGRTVVSTAPSDLQYLGWNNGSTQWEPKTIAVTLAGDVTGAYGSNTVTKVRGVTVSSTAPTSNQTLVYNSGATQWEPTAQAHDLATFYPGTLAASAVLLRHVAVRAWSLPTNASGSALSAGTAATGSTTLTLKKNGSSIGTAVVSASGTTAAFTVTATSFAALDVLTVEGPGTADATLGNVAVSLLGSR